MALVVITGGARSGKSAAAAALAAARHADGCPVTYIVFGRSGVDGEFDERVARHRAQRPAEWATIEVAAYEAVVERDLDCDGLVVVDCMGTWLGLCMEAAYESSATGALGDAAPDEALPGFEVEVAARFDSAIEWVAGRTGDTVVITNEVGDGVVPTHSTGRIFRDVLGRANRMLVRRADAAFLCVAGRLLDLSTAPDSVRWPED